MNAEFFDASALLSKEAYALDTQDWDGWLALFIPNSEFWVPAWKSEHEPTSNPKRELSLIYYSSRGGLEDRVWRVRSGRSVASKPMPRTQHAITNVMLAAVVDAGDALRVLSNFTVHQFRTKTRETEVLYGRYEHDLVREAGELKIRRKKIILLNDYMPAMLDYYCL